MYYVPQPQQVVEENKIQEGPVYPVLVPPVQSVQVPQDPMVAPPTAPEIVHQETCCGGDEEQGVQEQTVPQNLLEDLQKQLTIRQEMMLRRRLAFFYLLGMLVFFFGTLFAVSVPLIVTLIVSAFYVFGSLAIQFRSKVMLTIFALVHLYPFYILFRVFYELGAYSFPVSWELLVALTLITFSLVGSFMGSLRYACFLRRLGN
jgi:hypothetical protein